MVKKFLEGLTDEVLKKESKQEAKNEAISTIIKVFNIQGFVINAFPG